MKITEDIENSFDCLHALISAMYALNGTTFSKNDLQGLIGIAMNQAHQLQEDIKSLQEGGKDE